MWKKIAAVFMLTGFAALVTGCNTVEGFGQDVKATGRAVEKAADENKPSNQPDTPRKY
jgi:entericidin B